MAGNILDFNSFYLYLKAHKLNMNTQKVIYELQPGTKSQKVQLQLRTLLKERKLL